ncbi:hypothetical protein [Pandoraea sp.]
MVAFPARPSGVILRTDLTDLTDLTDVSDTGSDASHTTCDAPLRLGHGRA